MKGFVEDIGVLTEGNADFRHVLYTAKNMQPVFAMGLPIFGSPSGAAPSSSCFQRNGEHTTNHYGPYASPFWDVDRLLVLYRQLDRAYLRLMVCFV